MQKANLIGRKHRLKVFIMNNYKNYIKSRILSTSMLIVEELEEYRQKFLKNYIEDIHNQTNESHQRNN